MDLYCSESVISSSVEDYTPNHYAFQRQPQAIQTFEVRTTPVITNFSSSSRPKQRFQPAYADPNIFCDSTICLEALLNVEAAWKAPDASISCWLGNQGMEPYMRKIVVEWLLEVCKEVNCEEEVFPLTVNLFDRFLGVQSVDKMELQLVASTCLFIASKIRETFPIPADKVVRYAANSFTVEQLLAYEMYVLDRLDWDLGSVTSHEISDHLLYRLGGCDSKFALPEFFQKIRRHVRALLDLAHTDFAFCGLPASLLASAACLSTLCHHLPGVENAATFVDQIVKLLLLGGQHDIEADNTPSLIALRLEKLASELSELRLAFLAEYSPPLAVPVAPVPSSPMASPCCVFGDVTNRPPINSNPTTSLLQIHESNLDSENSQPSYEESSAPITASRNSWQDDSGVTDSSEDEHQLSIFNNPRHHHQSYLVVNIVDMSY